MLRRQARLRREYIYKKAALARKAEKHSQENIVEKCLQTNTPIYGNLQKDAIKIKDRLKYRLDDPNNVISSEQDDEYRYAGCVDPKIVVTTSHDPSSRLQMFVKELRILLPNAQKINRGKYEMKQLMDACRANDVTDIIIVHEHRGVPDNMIVSHLPYGPTAFFNISNVVMRHDIPKVGTMSEQKPHLVFYNFKTKLGERVVTILKHLFPVPKQDSKRVITFANNDDCIDFRHHTYKYVNRELEMVEVGPRFQLKLYQIKLGVLDEIKAADTEWVLRPYLNTAAKRRFLSDDLGWAQDEEDDYS